MLFPPFEPDRDEPKRRRFRPIPVRTLVPNVITLLALCAGLTAVRLAIEGKLDHRVVEQHETVAHLIEDGARADVLARAHLIARRFAQIGAHGFIPIERVYCCN